MSEVVTILGVGVSGTTADLALPPRITFIPGRVEALKGSNTRYHMAAQTTNPSKPIKGYIDATRIGTLERRNLVISYPTEAVEGTTGATRATDTRVSIFIEWDKSMGLTGTQMRDVVAQTIIQLTKTLESAAWSDDEAAALMSETFVAG